MAVEPIVIDRVALYRTGMSCALCLAFGAAVARAQAVDRATPVTSTGTLRGGSVRTLPVDSVVQGLLLLPGVEQSDAGLLVIRGGPVNGQSVYLEGVPISPGHQTSGYLYRLGTSHRLVSLDPALRLGINGLGGASVTTGAYEARYGNATSGIIAVDTRARTGPIGGDLRFETDALGGTAHGPGINRILADAGGSITDRFRFSVAAFLEGRQSADNGPGTLETPMFVPGASDTVISVPSTVGDPWADTTRVSINQFPIGRGQCDTFSASQDPGIASNYQTECTGIRLPASARSGYQLLGLVAFDPLPAGTLTFSALASQDQTRLFSYGSLTNGQQLRAHRSTSSALTLAYRHRLGAADAGWDLFGALSYQRDQAEISPLTVSGEASTRYPTGGFMIAPFDFLFGFDNFPINEELLKNFHDNIPHSRRSPYDIENTGQYQAYGLYRNDPSATGDFEDGGGPSGRLGLFKESRMVGVVSASWRPNRRHNVTLGGEYTDYSVTNYTSSLTSQVGADMYIEDPRRAALYLQDRFVAGRFTGVGGLRYDTFRSGARRPFLLDLQPTSETFNQYVYFPRTSSFQGTVPDGRPLTILVEDTRHEALTPHVQLGFALSARTSLWASAARQAQIPDLYHVYTGVNTDLSITTTGQAFSVDQGFNQVNIAEIGARHRFSPKLALEASLYYKDYTAETQVHLEPLQDPLSGVPRGIFLYRSGGGRTVEGLDIKADIDLGQVFSGWVGYSYANAKTADGSNPSFSRPHSFTGALSLALPSDWRDGTTLGTIGRNAGVYTIFRFASGQAYTRCPPDFGNESVLSGRPCPRRSTEPFNSSRLPAVNRLDLRLSKWFAVGSTFLNAFLDFRNLLNFGNTHTVYAVTGTTESEFGWGSALQNRLSGYMREASANGAELGNGAIQLPPAGACGDWIASGGWAAAPNCIYFIRAEQRYGNGDGVFDTAEQTAAIRGFYDVGSASPNFTDPPRRIRLGLEWRF